MSTVTIDGRELRLKNLDKVLFPGEGITKGEVIDYYRAVAGAMLPHLRDRPLTLQRFPDGIEAGGFFQQDRPDHFPAWIADKGLERAGDQGGTVHHVLCNDEATLVYLANQGVITLHGWLARAGAPEHPDRLVFDLDPPDDDFRAVRFAARRVGELMEALGMAPHVMTTGSRGLHVVAPLDAGTDFEGVRALGQAMAEWLAGEHPDALTTAQRKDKRAGRLYLDVMRNAYGQTAVAPYTLRAKPGAPVAAPLDWDELDRPELEPRHYHLKNLRNRLAQKDDPWTTMDRHRVSATRAREAL